MTNQSTTDKLIEMRLTAMADSFRSQLDDPKFKDVPFEDRFGMLVPQYYEMILLFASYNSIPFH
jgi:hypothetical protein